MVYVHLYLWPTLNHDQSCITRKSLFIPSQVHPNRACAAEIHTWCQHPSASCTQTSPVGHKGEGGVEAPAGAALPFLLETLDDTGGPAHSHLVYDLHKIFQFEGK